MKEEKCTRVWGYGNDNIEGDNNVVFDGGFHGEVGCYGDDNEQGVLVVMSDGTVLEVKYCGRVPGVWEVKLVRQGELFISIDLCDNEDADPCSDVAHFRPGIKWARAAIEWQDVPRARENTA